MGSITVDMFKPLVGTLGGGVTTGMWPEEVATTTGDEVDASLGGGYPGGPKSELGARYAGPEDLNVRRSADTGQTP
jgi:hypothetical protein